MGKGSYQSSTRVFFLKKKEKKINISVVDKYLSDKSV